MTRRFMLFAAVLAAIVVWPATASATTHLPDVRDGVQPSTRAAQNGAGWIAPPACSPRPARFVPLGTVLLQATVSGSGTVRDYPGAGIPAADVVWGLDVWGTYYDLEEDADVEEYIGWLYGGEMASDTGGSFRFSNSRLPSLYDIADYYDYDDAEWYLAFDAYFDSPLVSGATDRLSLWDQSTGAGSYSLRPGHVPYQLTRRPAGPYDDAWEYARVETAGSKGGASTLLHDQTGMVNAMAPYMDRAAVYFWSNVGLEVQQFSNVSPGQVGDGTISANESDASEIHVTSPALASGKPGCAAKVRLDAWAPQGAVKFYGYSESPSAGGYKAWKTSYQLPLPGTVSLSVPKSATPGYFYGLHVYRDDAASIIDLCDYVQVCTLKASATRISRGAGVRLSGVVPTEGHWGSRRGLSKKVVLYQSTRSRPQPQVDTVPGGPAPAGWKKVRGYTANGLGKYVTRLMHPRRTTWYVLHYEGDGVYWPAWTSVAKVTVR